MKPKILNFKLKEINYLGGDLRIFVFELNEIISFEPGQYLSIIFEKNGKKMLRQYSIISPPEEKNSIKLFIKKIRDGPGSNFLFNLKIGDKIKGLIPLGKFILEKDSLKKDLIFIGNGTGVAPLLSMIFHLLNQNFKKKIYLISGFKKKENIPEKDLLDKFEKKYGNFKHYNVLSKEDSVLKGHIQDYLGKLIPRKFKGDFYICGLKKMVEEIKLNLIEKGFEEKKIHFEKYD